MWACHRALHSYRPRGCSSAACRGASALSEATSAFQSAVLAATLPPETTSSSLTGSSSSCSSGSTTIHVSDNNGFAAVREQASMVSEWRSHALKPAERLMLSEALAGRLSEMGLPLGSSKCVELNDLFSKLLEQDDEDPSTLVRARSDGTGKSAVIRVLSAEALPVAAYEASALMMTGHAVSLAATGDVHETAERLLEGFPAQLMQAVEDAPGESLPRCVSVERLVGGEDYFEAAWQEHDPAPNFGGRLDSGKTFGWGTTALPLSLMRIDMARLGKLGRSRYELSQEAYDLASLLSTAPPKEILSAPGLEPPRWAKSAYDRRLEEVNDLLDTLWAFKRPDARTEVGLTAAPKNLIITKDSTEIPEEIVMAAVVAASSPFEEPVVLHSVGIGSRFFSKDPYRSFCRLVQSGRSGLQWEVQSHESWAAFIEWLAAQSSAERPLPVTSAGAPAIFGKLRGMEVDLQRLSARRGGMWWPTLFPADPLEQLRRWTRPTCEAARFGSRAELLAEVVWPPPPVEED